MSMSEQRTTKNKQTAALSAVTKKRNEIVKLMCNIDNLHLVKTAHEQITDLYANYQQCYIAHYDLLGEESEQDEESKRYSSKEISFLEFCSHVTAWVDRAERSISDELSVSNRTSLKSSKKSSATSALAREMARLAELRVEKNMFAERQALQ